MSRSLDKDILESLKSEDPTKVYQDIADLLSSFPENGLMEIELLGKSHPLEPGINYLRDEEAVAIPKLRLVQAFFVARQIIQRQHAAPLAPPSDDVAKATTIVLLMDPEHLTAANIRKRAVNHSLKYNAAGESRFHGEKRFVDSLLTARLHRHTKSPNLWNHRRWLMQCFKTHKICIDFRSDLINVVMVAAERHPRNYYAWHHARWLLDHSAPDKVPVVLLEAVADDVKDWCFRHHDDISGWTYLLFVLRKTVDRDSQGRKCSSILYETIQMVQSFSWMNESVWVFLRNVMSTVAVDDGLFDTYIQLNKLLYSRCKEGSADRRRLNEALAWALQHRLRRPMIR